uniref:Uncharacterized protein n=1 Tax=Glossina palpalis gambiensis TaxID=67801 RepID=A0A1B0B5C4_9MUSC
MHTQKEPTNMGSSYGNILNNVTQLISLMTSVAKFVEDIGEQLEFLLFSLNEETERLLYVQKHALRELQID